MEKVTVADMGKFTRFGVVLTGGRGVVDVHIDTQLVKPTCRDALIGLLQEVVEDVEACLVVKGTRDAAKAQARASARLARILGGVGTDG